MFLARPPSSFPEKLYSTAFASVRNSGDGSQRAIGTKPNLLNWFRNNAKKRRRTHRRDHNRSARRRAGPTVRNMLVWGTGLVVAAFVVYFTASAGYTSSLELTALSGWRAVAIATRYVTHPEALVSKRNSSIATCRPNGGIARAKCVGNSFSFLTPGPNRAAVRSLSLLPERREIALA